jgi:Rrf2 family protein
MKISTKGRYALRMMLDLAEHSGAGFVRLREIAERQQISDKYLEQITSQLVKAGFIKGVRGSQGGYKLSKSPSQYTIGSILRVTEGSLAPVACLDDPVNTCSRAADCPTLKLWKGLDNLISNYLDGKTLKDLM